ncbi:MAG: DUF4238 domain-containing protein [Deltaproteobacteria bacterium]|nr:DUF4238 domain-containing protein [Deltaproteobacteria bacterium]
MKRIDSFTPKKQHFIPQFVLKNFTSGKKKRVFVFDKHRKVAHASSVRDSACEKGFYNINIDGEEYTIENKLASLESISSKVISTVVQQETLANINPAEFKIFSLFCAVQLLRTPMQREFNQQFQDAIIDWINRQGGDVEQIQNFKVLDEAGIKQSHIHNINSLAIKFSEHFRDKALMLVKAPAGHEFFISDNPITMYNHIETPGRGNLGLALDGIEINIPLSKKLSLTFACPKMINEIIHAVKKYEQFHSFGFATSRDTRGAEELVYAIESGNATELKPENIQFYNSLQVIQSSRFVYSAKDDFSLIIDMLKTNPECKYSPKLQSN